VNGAAIRPVPASPALLARIERALKLVMVPFPHLAGLVAAARVTLDERVPTMGVFASGRLVANAKFVARLNESELVFVLAHEMLHLALRTHERARGADRLEFNYAHDYIINDILRAELGQPIPAGGLDMQGARERSAEEILVEMRRNGQCPSKTSVWEGEAIPARERLGLGRKAAGKPDGGNGGDRADGGDILDEKREREWFPDETADSRAQAERVKALAARALSLAAAMGLAKGLRGLDPGTTGQNVTALRGIYRAPWALALQRWIESVAPGERTFTRPSRRGDERTDVVLPGRRREGWLLNIVLDTSGSMTDEIPRALGTIAEACDAVGVDRVRLVQCDAAVTSDELITPEELAEREVFGYGGSDLSPALRHLAEDRDVRAVIVITDGEIAYPNDTMPYDVLWVLPPGASAGFQPTYGRVIVMLPPS